MIPFYTNIKDFLRYLILAVSLLLILGACNTRKFLNEDEFLLKTNSITFDAKEKIKKKRSMQYELKTLYKQKPNTKSFLVTKSNLWWYYKTDSLENPTKFQRWIRRRIAEPPALYNDKITQETANSMKYYLQNKGYYDAEVTFKKELNKKKKQANVTYIVNPKNLYTIDSVFFSSPDPKIQRVLNDSEEDSFLKRGEPVSENLYNKEVDRITKTLKNLGFAYFDRNFVDELTGDSTGTKVNIYLNILNPRNQSEHKIFRVGRVTVNPTYYPSQLPGPRKDSIIDGFRYLIDNQGTLVKPKSINREIFLKEGELYKDENFTKTNTQLGRLAIYKFISVKSSRDSIEEDKINFEIRLTPKKRMVIGGDLELNNSNYTGQNFNSSLIGIAVNFNYQNRNFRKNASSLELKANSGIELDIASPEDPIFSLDILTQADWYIPKFVEFPKIYSLANRWNVINDNFFKNLQEKAETRVSLSYNRLLLFKFYNYHSLNMSYGYDLQLNNNNRYSWNQTGINYLLPRFEEGFQETLDSNLFIRNSFTEQLFTGFIFRDLKYTHTSKSNLFGNSWKFIGDIEQSGIEILGINKLYNLASGNNKEFEISDSVRFSQYIRLNLDLRRYISIGKSSTFAYKVSVGIARPFGFSENVPYVKQFYGGGPFGNRAWRIRELGPGGYFEEILPDSDGNLIFYQAGDFKIDINTEYRFDIFWGFKGALFLDAANIWTINYDPERPGSQLRLTADPDVPGTAGFYKQFGVGVGVGLRYDFSYFVLGIDLGIKARNPFPDEEGRYWLLHEWNKLQLGDVNPNILIGFPF